MVSNSTEGYRTMGLLCFLCHTIQSSLSAERVVSFVDVEAERDDDVVLK
jgi:hypothetical protein